MVNLSTILFSLLLSRSAPIVQEPSGQLQNVHRIVCLGASITQFGEFPGGYVWLLRHYVNALYPAQNMEVINGGVSGNRSSDMLPRFKRDVLDRKPDLVTFQAGLNDVWQGFNAEHPKGDGPRGIPLSTFRSNLESMVSQAQAAKIKVVLLSITSIGEDFQSAENKKVEGYNATLRQIAHRHRALYVDLQKPFRALMGDYRAQTGGRDNLLTVDGVHMNPQGNLVFAHTLMTALGISPESQAKVQADVAKQIGK